MTVFLFACIKWVSWKKDFGFSFGKSILVLVPWLCHLRVACLISDRRCKSVGSDSDTWHRLDCFSGVGIKDNVLFAIVVMACDKRHVGRQLGVANRQDHVDESRRLTTTEHGSQTGTCIPTAHGPGPRLLQLRELRVRILSILGEGLWLFWWILQVSYLSI